MCYILSNSSKCTNLLQLNLLISSSLRQWGEGRVKKFNSYEAEICTIFSLYQDKKSEVEFLKNILNFWFYATFEQKIIIFGYC